MRLWHQGISACLKVVFYAARFLLGHWPFATRKFGLNPRLAALPLRDSNGDFVPLDAALESVHFHLGVVAPPAVMNAESPSVPGAGDLAPFQIATGEGCTHVGAEIVD